MTPCTLNVFVFKKTPVSKGQASLRCYERPQKCQESLSSKISSDTDATDESIGHKQQHPVLQGKRFSGIHIYISEFCEFKNSSVISS